MVIDCHSHLDDSRLVNFLRSYQSMKEDGLFLEVVSNSVDEESSLRNLSLSSVSDGIKAFVGIHPQVFSSESLTKSLQGAESKSDKEYWQRRIDRIATLLDKAKGLGEIGLDPKYGSNEMQEYIFAKQLELAEGRSIPITVHSRNSLRRCLEIFSTFSLRASRILFHWFAGEPSELREIQDAGHYVSFGLPILYSRRMQSLASASDPLYTLAETDSPLSMDSIWHGFVSTPFAIPSVVFELGRTLCKTFAEASSELDENARRYLVTQS